MNYGMYLSAGGALSSMHRMDVVANNLANVNTVGFKPDFVHTYERLPERIEDNVSTDPQWLLEQLGGGHLVDRTRIDLKQGNLQRTENDLDVAIQGEGFFVVSDRPGARLEDLHLTRDGRFALNSSNELVMVGTGLKVLDVEGSTIRLDSELPVRIASSGEVEQGNTLVAKIQMLAASDLQLQKVGDNLLRFDPTVRAQRVEATGQLHQGHVEGSAADPIVSLTRLIAVTKAFQNNVQLMQYHDNLSGQVISTFARVA